MNSTIKYSAIALCLFSTTQTFAVSKSNFCSVRATSTSIKKNVFNSEQFLTFRNQGGLINGGVCWWHSRFQRNAMLLVRFRENLDFPTLEQAKDIIKKIRKGKSVVELPGFSSISEFSYQFRDEIQEELEKWQIADGFLRQQWIVGLAGTSNTTEKKLKKKMDELYQYVKVEGNIAYQKLQIKGVDAHAWLVSDIAKTENGYDLKVLDSNYQRTQVYKYVEGMTSFYHSYYGNFVPYTERKREYRKVLKTVKKYCKQ
ncbi:hypothetical protein [Halobacteriovorax sp. HLS]|uniref:hypothetical protein n=1 Tax=Halobacteriovorax sp. HLS TaxID=2234000 RepID=UPI000FD93B9E|nr:hypothetical protein [Halobacteriovorax sp. HLS]